MPTADCKEFTLKKSPSPIGRSEKGNVRMIAVEREASLEVSICGAILSELDIIQPDDDTESIKCDYIVDIIDEAEVILIREIDSLSDQLTKLKENESMRAINLNATNKGEDEKGLNLQTAKIMRERVPLTLVFDALYVIAPDVTNSVADYVATGTLPAKLDPQICYSFPRNHVVKAESVESFCFPRGISPLCSRKGNDPSIDSEIKDYEFFVFLISGGGAEGGDTSYACCMYKWFAIPGVLHDEKTLYVPFCYCIIGKFPFLNLFKDILRRLLDFHSAYIEKQDMQAPPKSIPTALLDYLNLELLNLQTYKAPEIGSSLLISPFLGQSTPYALGRTPVEPDTDEQAMNILRWGIPILCPVLSSENIAQIIGFLMVEMRIIVVCEDLQLLTATVLVLTSLMRPLKWAGPVISILPPSLYEYIEAPVPFVLGVQEVPPNLTTTKGAVIIFPQRDEIVLNHEDMKSISSLQIPQKEKLVAELEPLTMRFREKGLRSEFSFKEVEDIIRTVRNHNKLIIETCEMLDTLADGDNKDSLVEAIGQPGLGFFNRLRSVQMYQTLRDNEKHKRIPTNETKCNSKLCSSIHSIIQIACSGEVSGKKPGKLENYNIGGGDKPEKKGNQLKRLRSIVCAEERKFGTDGLKQNVSVPWKRTAHKKSATGSFDVFNLESGHDLSNIIIAQQPDSISELSPEARKALTTIDEVQKRETQPNPNGASKLSAESVEKAEKEDNILSPRKSVTSDYDVMYDATSMQNEHEVAAKLLQAKWSGHYEKAKKSTKYDIKETLSTLNETNNDEPASTSPRVEAKAAGRVENKFTAPLRDDFSVTVSSSVHSDSKHPTSPKVASTALSGSQQTQLATFKTKLRNGVLVIKHGRRGKPRTKILICDATCSYLTWRSPYEECNKKNGKFKDWIKRKSSSGGDSDRKELRVKGIRFILEGKRNAKLDRAEANDDKCITIVGAERNIIIEVQNEKEYKLILSGLQLLISTI